VAVGLQLERPIEDVRELVVRKLRAGEEMAGHQGIVVRVLAWNLFHGRDLPAAVDYKRSLHAEFAAFLARLEWDVALLQEAPPRWFHELASGAGADGRLVKTSRNQFAFLRGWIADRWPDLIKSGEGGSNQILFRPPWSAADERHLTLALLPERRRMIWLRLQHPGGTSLCVANLHAAAHEPERAAREVERAARVAREWSGDLPLILGGDFNVRPAEQPWLFERLEADGFTGPTGEKVIDHVLARGLRVVERPHQLPPERRDVPAPGAERVRLSDHAPVVAAFEVG
jgi:endonuclease/exonuclease/phosphatase family metal-dependent hydrolase